MVKAKAPDLARPSRPATPPEREADRLSRPQPPRVIPTRVRTPPPPGLVAYQVLGGQVIR